MLPGLVTISTGAANYNAAFDVGLIPFHASDANDSINPVKMYMHLLAGKACCGNEYGGSVEKLEPLVYSAKNDDDFILKV